MTAETKVKSVDASREVYLELCKSYGVIPSSHFLRHLQDSYLSMGHYGLAADGMKPLAAAMIVSICLLTHLVAMSQVLA